MRLSRTIPWAVRAFTACAALSVWAIPPSAAFQPDATGHVGITNDALHVYPAVSVGGKSFTFDDKAIKQIAAADRSTDLGLEFFVPEAHFDDEMFAQSSTRLMTLKKEIIEKLTLDCPDGEAARKRLGRAFHTLQDFYAHSNWVELVNTGKVSGFERRLGRSEFDASTIPGPGELAVAGAGERVAALNDAGKLDAAGLTKLTTGYYEFSTLGCSAPAGKLRHGGFACSTGLAKDSTSVPTHKQAYDVAVQATTDYLNQIIDVIKDNPKALRALMHVNGTLSFVIDTTSSMTDDIDAVKLSVAAIVTAVQLTDNAPDHYLLETFNDPEVGKTFITCDPAELLTKVLALDAEGGGDCPEYSMSGALHAVLDGDEYSHVFLFTDADAKDPLTSIPVVAAALYKGVSITTFLSGTCEDFIDPTYLAVSGLTGGYFGLLEKSDVASTFDLIRPELSGDFVPLLSVQGNLDDSSSTALAAKMPAHTGAALSTQATRGKLRVAARGARRGAGSTRDFNVLVDSSVTNLVAYGWIESKDGVELYRPSGAQVLAGDPSVKITTISNGCILTVKSPEAGAWRLHIAGAGVFSASVKSNTAIQLTGFNFVTLSGSEEHQGFAPIAGQPLAGSVQTGSATLTGPYATANFQLVDEEGKPIAPISLKQGSPHAGSDEFVGDIPLPAQPFRVSVSGMDKGGNNFTRVYPTLFRAQTIEVTADNTVSTLSSGGVTPVAFVVHNVGAAGTFRVGAADSLGYVGGAQPSSLTLGTGEKATVTVNVAVPDNAVDGTTDAITATASSTSDETITNGATLNVGVAAGDHVAPKILGASVDKPVLWPASGQFVKVEVNYAVTDNKDTAPLSSLQVSSNEPVGHYGRGTPAADWIIVDAHHLLLRALRDAKGHGRVYTISISATDHSGNNAVQLVTVTVPLQKTGGRQRR